MRKASLLACLAALALSSCAHPQCCIPQTPRNLWPQDQRATASFVERGPDNSVYYTPRVGVRQQLFLCSHHYHCYVENYQQCLKDLNVPPPTGKEACQKSPSVGDWIEVHTAYAAKVRTPCTTPESLDCCLAQPIVVRGYHAKVTDGKDPLPDPWGLPLLQWSGSSTGPDKTPGECKVAAQWSFTPGCDLRVSREVVIDRFKNPDRPRALQPPERLSKDLTLVTPP